MEWKVIVVLWKGSMAFRNEEYSPPNVAVAAAVEEEDIADFLL